MITVPRSAPSPAPRPQVPPEYMMMAQAVQAQMHPKIQTHEEMGMTDEQFSETWKRSVGRLGRSDDEIMKLVGPNEEAFAFGGSSDLIGIHKKRPAKEEKPEDLVS